LGRRASWSFSDRGGRLPEGLQQRRHDTAALFDERHEQMLGLRLGVCQGRCEPRRGDDGLLGLFSERVEIHGRTLRRNAQ
jgi:hypothetical protein